MTKRVASLLLGLWLLAAATSTSAECAWVLWTTSYRMVGETPTAELISPPGVFRTKGKS